MKVLAAHRSHSRRFEDFKFVYPVLSRRARGISIGLNTNPDKACNFNCIYCQVDRTQPSAVRCFDLDAAENELREMLAIVQTGELAKVPPFDSVPAKLLRLNDIALSGDGEPTALRNFSDAIDMVIRHQPQGVKIILITGAAGLGRADVKRGLELLDTHDGEVWVKLDAGTNEYFKLINRTHVPFQRILKNITATAHARPVTIQSLFLKLNGHGPSVEEINAYCERLTGIVADGGQIRLVQVSTLARRTMAVVGDARAWQYVAALSDAEVDAIADVVRQRTGLATESFYGG